MFRIAVLSFPGNNCEVESLRSIRRVGMEPVYFRWNEDRAKLKDIDGYFLPGGFSYEDRGRSGMVAARDPLMGFIRDEAESGKPVIGICNGAQILVESGVIPNGDGLQMCLARNAIRTEQGIVGLPLLSEWVWITRSCAKDRCATSNWDGVLQIPMAHGEGRFTTRDKDLIDELKRNDQIAFSYCDAEGNISDDPLVTPNGSMLAIAGICNPEGNVVALMPHPERAREAGDVYFESVRKWIMRKGTKGTKGTKETKERDVSIDIPVRQSKNVEIFIETIITNNEERTVEQAARRVAPKLKLKQWKYLSVPESKAAAVLRDLTIFNKNKERALTRNELTFPGTMLLRRDIPDTGAASLGKDAETGIAYGIEGISEQELCSGKLLEIFANPHASTLEKLSF